MTEPTTKRLSLSGEIGSIEERLEEIKEEGADVKEEWQELNQELVTLDDESDEYAEKTQRREELKDEWRELDTEFAELKTRLNVFEKYVKEWDDDEFVIKELTFGDTMRAQDEVRSAESSVGGVRNGYHKIQVLERGVLEAPDDAPDKPENYPHQIGDWLFDRIDALSTFGETKLGNLSLESEI